MHTCILQLPYSWDNSSQRERHAIIPCAGRVDSVLRLLLRNSHYITHSLALIDVDLINLATKSLY